VHIDLGGKSKISTFFSSFQELHFKVPRGQCCLLQKEICYIIPLPFRHIFYYGGFVAELYQTQGSYAFSRCSQVPKGTERLWKNGEHENTLAKKRSVLTVQYFLLTWKEEF
jgi:hypothetical protein